MKSTQTEVIVDNVTHPRRLWRAFVNGLVQDVPDAIALCEFDCCKSQCSATEWASCARRLERAAREISSGKEDLRVTQAAW